jgi:hypothetical protein
MRRGAGAILAAIPGLGCLVVLAAPAVAHAQTPAPAAATPAVTFLSAYQARLGASRLGAGDDALEWEGRFGGDVDLVDFGSGRFNFAAAYDVVLGSQRRAFDPTQGRYTLDFRLTHRMRRLGVTEIAGVFHHVSRHLSDRPKVLAVDWNFVGAEVLQTGSAGRLRTERLLRGGWTVKRSYVDYTWQAGGLLRLAWATGGSATFIGEASVDFIGVDTRIAGGSTEVAAYGEGGVRLAGRAAALELFAAFERRVDADPIARGPRNWALVGFRIVNR